MGPGVSGGRGRAEVLAHRESGAAVGILKKRPKKCHRIIQNTSKFAQPFQSHHVLKAPQHGGGDDAQKQSNNVEDSRPTTAGGKDAQRPGSSAPLCTRGTLLAVPLD